jgi:hypothetical protein
VLLYTPEYARLMLCKRDTANTKYRSDCWE